MTIHPTQQFKVGRLMQLQNITYLKKDWFPNVRSTTEIYKSEDTKVKRHKKVTVKLNEEMKI